MVFHFDLKCTWLNHLDLKSRKLRILLYADTSFFSKLIITKKTRGGGGVNKSGLITIRQEGKMQIISKLVDYDSTRSQSTRFSKVVNNSIKPRYSVEVGLEPAEKWVNVLQETRMRKLALNFHRKT